ncbi:MAG TPA: AarF/UbiB family protein [Kofleriaceae bacterium]|nr:AarF/UbiB family protein [Kofleriaceae bacterium]
MSADARAAGAGELARALLESWTGTVRATVGQLVADLVRDSRTVQRRGAALGDAVAARATPFVHAARATPRAARLAAESAQLFAAYRWHEARARVLPPAEARAERDDLDRRWAERIYQLCIELRGAVLKLGQFASTRRDLLPPAYVEALGRLQDAVPPVPFERIAERVRAELGAPIEALFREFESAPMAAGSLAQVHGAVLPGGARVAVKVQVPDVETEVEADLAMFSLAAGALRDLVPALDLRSIADELARSVRQELDFRLEADSASRVANDLAGDDSVLVPRVHHDLSSARVLTMDRVDGERLTEFLDRASASGGAAEGHRDAVLAALVRAYAGQILGAGRFQADPHPGNFLVCPDRRLALLDFGAVRELGDGARRAYAALTGAVIARDGARAARLMADLGFAVRPGGDPSALLRFADLLLDAFRPAPDRPLADIDPRAAFDETLALGRASPILIPDHFVQIGRVLAAIAGLVLAYRPRIALWPLIAPHLSIPPDAPASTAPQR